ncbi:MAG: signal peptidase II [Micropepsaceae bacterium]
MKQLFQRLNAVQLGLLMAALGLVFDQAWKLWFLFGERWVDTLGPVPNGIRYEVLPFFDIVMVWNYGISYGLLWATTDFGRWMLALVAITVTGFLVWWLRSVKDLRLAAAIGLIIGGALGNVIDRIIYGAVADFFLLHAFGYNWYVFNIADMAVVGGVLLMGLDLLLNEYKAKLGGAKEDNS